MKMIRNVLAAVFYDTDGNVRRYASSDGRLELRHNQTLARWEYYENGQMIDSSCYRLNIAIWHRFNLMQDFSLDDTKTNLVVVNPLVNDEYTEQYDDYDEKVND